jgi:hypothetical protein
MSDPAATTVGNVKLLPEDSEQLLAGPSKSLRCLRGHLCRTDPMTDKNDSARYWAAFTEAVANLSTWSGSGADPVLQEALSAERIAG